MLDSSFLKILLFTLVLSSCGGGNSSATTPSEGSFLSQPKSINGLVVDGYIRMLIFGSKLQMIIQILEKQRHLPTYKVDLA